MPEHVNITDPDIHEPKGASTATLDEVYSSDGAASGDWKKIYVSGVEDWNDGGSSQPLTNGSWVDLTNDGTGTNTSTTYQLPGFSDIWDTTNNQFDWDGAGLSLGDTVLIRFDVTVTTAAANDVFGLRLDMAHGSGSEYNLTIYQDDFDASGTYEVVVLYQVYMGNSITLNNPAKVAAYTDSAGNSVVVNGWSCTVIPRNAVLA